MKLLLDTHILLWSLLEPEKLSPAVIEALEKEDNELWLSPITTWEIILLAEKNRISLDKNGADWIQDIYHEIPFKEATLNHQVAIESRLINISHQDPADRFLAATAKIYNLTFVTADERLIELETIDILAN